MNLCAIDPGYARSGHGCALAFFDCGNLRGIGYARDDDSLKLLRIPPVDLVIWEEPQFDRRSMVNPGNIVHLAGVGGVVAGWIAGYIGARIESVTPSVWKGSVPKPIHHKRVWSSLDSTAQALLGGDAAKADIDRAVLLGASSRWANDGAAYYKTAKVVDHNILDAVALGLWRMSCES
jgi:hypothetical protein